MDLKKIVHEGMLPNNEVLKSFFIREDDGFVKSFYDQLEWGLIQGNYDYFIEILKANQSFYLDDSEPKKEEELFVKFLDKLKKEVESVPYEHFCLHSYYTNSYSKFYSYSYTNPYPVFQSLRPLPPDEFHLPHIFNLLITAAFLPTHKELWKKGYSDLLINKKNSAGWERERQSIVGVIQGLSGGEQNNKAQYFITQLLKINQKELFFNKRATDHSKIKEGAGAYWNLKDITPGRDVWNLNQPYIKAICEVAKENVKPTEQEKIDGIYKKHHEQWESGFLKNSSTYPEKEISQKQTRMTENGTPLFPFDLTPVYNFLKCEGGAETIIKTILTTEADGEENLNGEPCQKQKETIFFGPLKESFGYNKLEERVFMGKEDKISFETYKREEAQHYSTLKKNLVDYFKKLFETQILQGLEPFEKINTFNTLCAGSHASTYEDVGCKFLGETIRELHDSIYSKKGLGNEFYQKIYNDYLDFFKETHELNKRRIPYQITLAIAEIIKHSPKKLKEENSQLIEETLLVAIEAFSHYITPKKNKDNDEREHKWTEYYGIITGKAEDYCLNRQACLAKTIFSFPEYFSDHTKHLELYKTKIIELRKKVEERSRFGAAKEDFHQINLYFDMCEANIEKIMINKSIKNKPLKRNKSKPFRF